MKVYCISSPLWMRSFHKDFSLLLLFMTHFCLPRIYSSFSFNIWGIAEAAQLQVISGKDLFSYCLPPAVLQSPVSWMHRRGSAGTFPLAAQSGCVQVQEGVSQEQERVTRRDVSLPQAPDTFCLLLSCRLGMIS